MRVRDPLRSGQRGRWRGQGDQVRSTSRGPVAVGELFRGHGVRSARPTTHGVSGHAVASDTLGLVPQPLPPVQLRIARSGRAISAAQCAAKSRCARPDGWSRWHPASKGPQSGAPGLQSWQRLGGRNCEDPRLMRGSSVVGLHRTRGRGSRADSECDSRVRRERFTPSRPDHHGSLRGARITPSPRHRVSAGVPEWLPRRAAPANRGAGWRKRPGRPGGHASGPGRERGPVSFSAGQPKPSSQRGPRLGCGPSLPARHQARSSSVLIFTSFQKTYSLARPDAWRSASAVIHRVCVRRASC